MFNFKEEKPKKGYGRVKRGWHQARIYQAELRNAWNDDGEQRQYIKVDFEIIKEEEYCDVLVPGFFGHNKNRPNRRFLKLGYAAGLQEDYGDDLNAVLRDLWGKEVLVFVLHRYKEGLRRDRVEDYKPLHEESITLEAEMTEELNWNDSAENGELPF
jgi:hypothetical protein